MTWTYGDIFARCRYYEFIGGPTHDALFQQYTTAPAFIELPGAALISLDWLLNLNPDLNLNPQPSIPNSQPSTLNTQS